MRFAFAIAALFMAIGSMPANAAILLVQNNKLIGAQGVIVNGEAYDVALRDGRCFDLFSGCNENTDFPFATFQAAVAAASAFNQQVQSISPVQMFGCEIANNSCSVWTPGTILPGDTFVLSASSIGLNDLIYPYTDFSSSRQFTWAVWTPSSVPEPATWAMMLVGFGLAGAAMRRRQSRTSCDALSYRC